MGGVPGPNTFHADTPVKVMEKAKARLAEIEMRKKALPDNCIECGALFHDNINFCNTCANHKPSPHEERAPVSPPAVTDVPLFTCPCCGGDGKETCDNPDHGLIGAMGFHEVGRLGCPVCGHDPNHKVKNGGPCDVCGGSGSVTDEKGKEYAGIDWDPVPVEPPAPVSTVSEWKLPEPPAGREWHKRPWAEAMLPDGFRPLLLHETPEYGDEYWYEYHQWTARTSFPADPINATHYHHRTRRPLPTAFLAGVAISKTATGRLVYHNPTVYLPWEDVKPLLDELQSWQDLAGGGEDEDTARTMETFYSKHPTLRP